MNLCGLIYNIFRSHKGSFESWITYLKRIDVKGVFMGPLDACEEIRIPVHDVDRWFLIRLRVQNGTVEVWDSPTTRTQSPRSQYGWRDCRP
ncbi:hypothetical protein L484_019184 [Morus notabilis]|uniref:Uncharacterized protein n=1 Tax=Morus notabilis TaxID=981085 RepID=W9QUQ8_9ROSA|nr:hypothetical protein L484_019184 [Morus notabilis]